MPDRQKVVLLSVVTLSRILRVIAAYDVFEYRIGIVIFVLIESGDGVHKYRVACCPLDLLRGEEHVEGSAFVDFVPQLVKIPGFSEKTVVHNPDIRPDPLYFLRIPEGIGVIVTEREQKR